MTYDIVAQHTFISMTSWALALVAGGTLGWAAAHVAAKTFRGCRLTRELGILMPWRTVGLAVAVAGPLCIFIWPTAIGNPAGVLVAAACVFPLAVGHTYVELAEERPKSPVLLRLIGMGRTLAVLSAGAALFGAVVGGGGGGDAFLRGLRMAEVGQLMTGAATVVFVGFLFDVLGGAAQLLGSRATGKAGT